MSKKKQATQFADDVVVKPIIRTQFNAPLLPKYHEHNKEPSNTVPDQSMPLKVILDRFTRGLPLDIPLKNDYYEGDNEETIDMRHLDLAEQQELMEMARANTLALEQRLADQAQKRKQLQIETLRTRERKLREELQNIKEQKSEHGFRNADSKNQTLPPSPMKTD